MLLPFRLRKGREIQSKPLNQQKGNIMAKKSRGGRMTAAKGRAAKTAGGKGLIKNRPAGRKIMST
jgi:hypothetical protein